MGKKNNFSKTHFHPTSSPWSSHGSDFADKLKKELYSNITEQPNDLNYESKEFGHIFVQNFDDPDYTVADVRWFFSALDYANDVFVYVNNPKTPFVDYESLLSVKIGYKTHYIPATLFWDCLPYETKKQAVVYKDYFKNLKYLMSLHGRTLFIKRLILER